MAAGSAAREPSIAAVVWAALHWVRVACRSDRVIALAVVPCLIACAAGCSGLLTTRTARKERLVEPKDISLPVQPLVATKVHCQTCGWEVYLLARRPLTVHRCPVCGWHDDFSSKTEGVWQTLPFEGYEDVIFFCHEMKPSHLERLSNAFLPQDRVNMPPQGGTDILLRGGPP